MTAAAALTIGGCGSSSGPHDTVARHSPNAPGTFTLPAPGPTGVKPPAAATRVIEAWSRALREGHVIAAAAYFALPMEFVNGAGAANAVSVLTIHDSAQARVANESLPCGATFVSADLRGGYVNTLFRLGSRAGPGAGNCGSGPSQTARVNFRIARGKIVAWLRAPDDPGDNGAPPGTPTQPPTVPPGTPTQPSPTVPQTSTGPSPVV